MMTDDKISRDDDKVPLFKSWSYWYVLVMVVFLLLIIFFSFFTKQFS